MSKKTNKDIAVEAFEITHGLNEVHVTTDGTPFEQISDAENYAQKKFTKPADRKVETFTREDLKVKRPEKASNRVTDAVAKIREAKTPQAVDVLTQHEIRPFVLAQAKLRKKELGVEENATGDSGEVEKLQKENQQLKKSNASLEGKLQSESEAKQRAEDELKKMKSIPVKTEDAAKKTAPKTEKDSNDNKK